MSGGTKAVGGGPAVGLADTWVSGLEQLFNSGGIGTAGMPNAAGSTADIMSVLTDILSGGKGNAGSAISQLISQQQTRDVNALRARFSTGGGTAFGTPAMYAESQYRAQAAPAITNAITGLQLQAIIPLLGMINQTANKGISQRQVVQTPSPFAQGLGILTKGLGAAMPWLTPAFASGIPAAPDSSFLTNANNNIPGFSF